MRLGLRTVVVLAATASVLSTGIAGAGSTEHAAGNLHEAEHHLRSAHAILPRFDDSAHGRHAAAAAHAA